MRTSLRESLINNLLYNERRQKDSVKFFEISDVYCVNDKKLVEIAADEMTKITGQKSVVALSKKDISNFKLRKGMPIGVKVTLRKDKMY